MSMRVEYINFAPIEDSRMAVDKILSDITDAVDSSANVRMRFVQMASGGIVAEIKVSNSNGPSFEIVNTGVSMGDAARKVAQLAINRMDAGGGEGLLKTG